MTTANPQRGQLGFEVAGEQWAFAFTTNALCAIEDAFDLADVSQLGAVLGNSPSLRTVRTLFRIGLTDCQPDMTDREAGRIMDAVGGLEPSIELVAQAVQQAFPEGAKNGNADPRRAPVRPVRSARGTGRSSTPSGAKPA